MEKLTVSCFNNHTWSQNEIWKERNEYAGCIYNTPVYVKYNIPLEMILYVIEMNNDTNKIMGIGRLKNLVYADKKYNIYDDRNYNRFTYKGKKRITRDIIPTDILEKIEARVFTTKKHLKRGQGIRLVPVDMNKEYIEHIQKLFI